MNEQPDHYSVAFQNFVRRRQAALGRQLNEQESQQAQEEFMLLPEHLVLDLAGRAYWPAEDSVAPKPTFWAAGTGKGNYTNFGLFKYVAAWGAVCLMTAWGSYADGWTFTAIIWLALCPTIIGLILWHAGRWPFNSRL